MSAGKQIRLYLVDGRPGGLLIAEIMNWTGHVMAAPRSDKDKLLKREEAKRTGVYLLVGGDTDEIYIGETDELHKRLNENRHERFREDWWDRVILITSKDANVTKAHVRYLESRLIKAAKAANRSVVLNKNDGSAVALPEADRSDMDYFMEQLDIVLPVINVNAFREPQVASAHHPAAPVSTDSSASPEFFLTFKKLGASAVAQQIDGEFVVRAGSTAAPRIKMPVKAVASTERMYKQRSALHAALISKGALEIRGEIAQFVHDTVFSSPSAAGAIVQGQVACNGRAEWKTATGQSFGAWEDETTEPEGPSTTL
jgi:hypothetical protein